MKGNRQKFLQDRRPCNVNKFFFNGFILPSISTFQGPLLNRQLVRFALKFSKAFSNHCTVRACVVNIKCPLKLGSYTRIIGYYLPNLNLYN